MIRRAALNIVIGLAIGIAFAAVACGGNENSTSRAIPALSQKSSGPANALDDSGSVTGSAEVPGAVADSNGESASAAAAALALDRKIIQNIALDLQVEDVPQAFERVKSVADGAGGFVLDSSRSTQDPPQADLTLRVPAAAADGVLQQLRGLATKVQSETSKAQDVTGEYTDLQAQLRNSRAVETQYLDMLNKAQTIPDMLSIQDRLTQVRLEIEQTQGRANAIDTLSSLATISVHLRTEPVVEQPQKTDLDPLAAAVGGWGASLTFLRAAGVATLAVSAFLWWCVPLLVVAGVASLFFVRRSGGRASR